MRMIRWISTVAVAAMAVGATATVRVAHAQGTTTGAITGLVSDPSGAPLSNAQIEIINRSTGFRVGALTRSNGRYFVQSLEVGGPYTVNVRLIGFAPASRTDVTVSLTQATRADFTLQTQAAVLSGVRVEATVSGAEFSGTRQGAGTTVGDTLIRRMPTLSRDFTELVKLTPQVTNPTTGGASAGGSFNRSNSFTVDGANQSDRFNLNSSGGTPGGATGGRIISIDAVKEFTVQLSPTDVRQGNFTGMLVNAVTRNGTNTFTGGATYTFRNPSLAYDTAFIKTGDLRQQQYGFTLGGPIIKDKLHFFIAPEWQRRTAPNLGPSFSGIAGDTTSFAGVRQAQVDSVIAIARNFPGGGFDAGNAGVLRLETPLANLFGRLDWQINGNSRLVLRQISNRAEQVDFSRNTNSFNPNAANQVSGIRLTSNQVPRTSKNNSTVAQLFTNFANGWANELSFGYNTINDVRNPPVRSPEISVAVGSTAITIGTEQFSPVNVLDQRILELTENLTVPLGLHNLTFGGRVELNHFNNDFQQRVYGAYKFPSINALRLNQPSAYSVGFSNGAALAAEFDANVYSVYAQDQWSATPNFTLTFGLRADMPDLPTTPPNNPLISGRIPNVSTANKPKSQVLWSPRAGFNWDVTGTQRTQVRGNVGVYTGQPPFVMIGNAYQNSGMQLVFLNCQGTTGATATPAFTTDVNNLPRSCAGAAPPAAGQAGTAGINLTDPDFKYPQNLTGTVGFDQRLPYGFVFTGEALYRRALNGLFIRDLNLRGPRLVNGAPYRDRNGRVLYADSISATGTVTNAGQKYIATIGTPAVTFNEGAIYLTNQSEDYNYTLSGQLRKRFAQSVELTGAYTYMQSKDVQSLTSDRAVSNFNNGRVYAGLESEAEATTSYFERPHRVLLYGTYTAPWKSFATDVSLFYEGMSGSPFTFTANGDLNGDGVNTNDPLYIPRNAADAAEIRIGSGTGAAYALNAAEAAKFDKLISSLECANAQRGQIMARNSCRGPFQHRMDLSIRQTLPQVAGQRLTAQLDVFNLLNLLNSDWGHIDFPANSPNFPQQQLLTAVGRTAGPLNQSLTNFTVRPEWFDAQGNPRAYLPPPNSSSQLYQMQLSFRYSF